MYARKNNGKKILAVVLAVMLLMLCAVGGTLAWLSAQSEAVTNTFSVGNITIELWEHELKDGQLDMNSEVTANTGYKIVPGATQGKDPFVRVKETSEKCYVYVCVDNALGTNVTYNIDEFDWTEIPVTDTTKKLYRFDEILDASAGDVTETVFSKITYSGDITEETIGALDGLKITINAFAHQAEHTDMPTPDVAALAHFGLTAANS